MSAIITALQEPIITALNSYREVKDEVKNVMKEMHSLCDNIPSIPLWGKYVIC